MINLWKVQTIPVFLNTQLKAISREPPFWSGKPDLHWYPLDLLLRKKYEWILVCKSYEGLNSKGILQGGAPPPGTPNGGGAKK